MNFTFPDAFMCSQAGCKLLFHIQEAGRSTDSSLLPEFHGSVTVHCELESGCRELNICTPDICGWKLRLETSLS